MIKPRGKETTPIAFNMEKSGKREFAKHHSVFSKAVTKIKEDFDLGELIEMLVLLTQYPLHDQQFCP